MSKVSGRERHSGSLALAALVGLVLSSAPVAAQSIDTSRVVADSLWSGALGTWKRFLVYLPPSYGGGGERYPAVYYLHGWSGNETDWVERGRIRAVADSLSRSGMRPMLLIFPDGDDSWYTTWNALGNRGPCEADARRRESAATYCVPWPHYDDYLAHELVDYVDRRYRTTARRESRGIAGLSMGGYGALAIALSYADRFAAAASHSGVVAPLHTSPAARPRKTRDDWSERARFYGAILSSMELAFGRDSIGWRARDIAALAARARARGTGVPTLWIDCGVEDGFIGQNRMLHAFLLSAHVPHVWREMPGSHNWSYWRANVVHSLQWFASVLSP